MHSFLLIRLRTGNNWEEFAVFQKNKYPGLLAQTVKFVANWLSSNTSNKLSQVAMLLAKLAQTVKDSGPVYLNEFSSIFLILPAALASGIYSASNKNEYQN
jgi:hypothetical protein